MKLLFTGAHGFLGRHVIPILRANSLEVKTLGTHQGDYIIDLKKEVPRFDEQFEVIFHAAGKAHSIPSGAEEEKEFFEVNYNGTVNLCGALKNRLPKVFIYVSTVAVYGKEWGKNIDENTSLMGESPYAKSKILAEEFLQQWCTENGVKLFILRPSLIAGPNPPGNLGDMIKAVKSNRYFNIGGGNAEKSIFWVEDFAGLIMKLINTEKEGIYNVCDSENYSFKEISEMISQKLGKNKPLNIPMSFAKLLGITGDFFGDRFPINSQRLKKMTESLTFSNHKLTSELGFIPSAVKDKFQI